MPREGRGVQECGRCDKHCRWGTRGTQWCFLASRLVFVVGLSFHLQHLAIDSGLEQLRQGEFLSGALHKTKPSALRSSPGLGFTLQLALSGIPLLFLRASEEAIASL